METITYGITSFLVSGAAIVIAAHAWLTIRSLGCRRHLTDADIAQIHEALRTDEHRADPGPRFDFPPQTFRGFSSPEGRF